MLENGEGTTTNILSGTAETKCCGDRDSWKIFSWKSWRKFPFKSMFGEGKFGGTSYSLGSSKFGFSSFKFRLSWFISE